MKWLVITLNILLLGFVSSAGAWTHGNPGGGASACTTLAGLSCDANGWTVLTPAGSYCAGQSGSSPPCNPASTATRIIYVSTSGTDNSTCGTLAAPCATPAFGATLLTDTHPDWLLMKCGDVWTHAAIGIVNKAGLNASNPMVFSSYDPLATQSPPLPDPYSCSARPQFNLAPGDTSAWGTFTGDFIAYVGLAAYAFTRDPASPDYSSTDSQTPLGSFSVDSNFTTMLVEDCIVSFFQDSFDIETPDPYFLPSNFIVRRNALVKNYAFAFPGDPSTVGMLFGAASNTLSIYENIFDHNGWNTCVSGQPGCGSNTITWAPQSGFKHNVYFAAQGQNGDLKPGISPTVTGNIFANEPSAPAFRTSAFSTQNLCVADPFCSTSNSTVPGVTNTFSNNVALQSLFSSADTTMGLQLVTRYINENLQQSPTNIFNNILSGGVGDPLSGQGFQLGNASNGNHLLGNIIFNWSYGTPANAIVNDSACNLTATTGCPLFSSNGFANITSPGSAYTDKSIAISGSQSSNTAYHSGFFNWAGDGQNYDIVLVPGDTAANLAQYGITYSTSGNLVGVNQSTVLDYGAIATLASFTATTCSASPLGCADGTYPGVLLTGGNNPTAPVPALADIVVSGGKVTSVAITTGPSGFFCQGTGAVCGGNRYISGDVLSVDPTSIGGVSGGTTNFTVPVATFQPAHVIIYGTTCNATCSGSFTGTLYYPWYQVPLSCTGVGSSGCAGTTGATGAQADLISAGGQIVSAWILGSDNQWCGEVDNSGGTGYSVGDTLNAPSGTALAAGSNRSVSGAICAAITGGFSWNGSSNTGSGMVITIPSGGIAFNTIAATGCNLATQNAIDAVGASTSCTYTDPNRSAGSYYATGGGGAWTPTANATMTATVSGGVMNVSAISGSLSAGDAISWSGQTKHDYILYNATTTTSTSCGGSPCTGSGGTGTYALTGVNATAGGQTALSSWSPQQLIALQDNVFKATWGSNNLLSACNVNNYIRQGFGVAVQTCPPVSPGWLGRSHAGKIIAKV